MDQLKEVQERTSTQVETMDKIYSMATSKTIYRRKSKNNKVALILESDTVMLKKISDYILDLSVLLY